jgi:hypothetical protein
MNDSIVVNGVTYYSEKPAAVVNQDLLDKYEWLKNEIGLMLSRSQKLYDQMKLEGLCVGMIEAEGCLRTAKEMQKWLEYIETWGN